LSRKQWYYRNGQFFCKKSCWEKAKEKAAETAAKEKPQPADAVPAKPA